MKKNNQSIIIAILVIIIIGVGAFFGGMKYQESKSLANRPGMGQFEGNEGNMMFERTDGNTNVRRGFGGVVMGDVVSVDQNSITVKLSDGSSKIVNLTKSTTYSKTDAVSQSDVTNGTKVAVIGATNSDGSVTATRVEINPTQPIGSAYGKASPVAK
jgi:hypothetical protein